VRETWGHESYYGLPDPKHKQATQWLISNPKSRVNLGRMGLSYKGSTIFVSQIANIKQELDLWKGTITSIFEIGGKIVKVITQGDSESDAVAFSIESDLISYGDL
jgi:hypothetical protein